MNASVAMVGLGSASAPPVLMTNHGAARSGKPSGHSPDPRKYRALYPDRWIAFLKAHFRDHMQVAYFFGVSERTGRDWWEGKTGSQGWAVAYAVDQIPTAAEYLRAA